MKHKKDKKIYPMAFKIKKNWPLLIAAAVLGLYEVQAKSSKMRKLECKLCTERLLSSLLVYILANKTALP